MIHDLILRYEKSPFLTFEETEHLNQLLKFIEQESECFERTLKKGHITGSSFILNYEKNAIALTHHKKLNLWLQPGGHSDGDPDTLNVALREAQEETGITSLAILHTDIFDVDIHKIPETSKEPAHYHYDIRFLFRAPADAKFVMSEESNDLTWAPLAKLENFTLERSVHRMKEKWNKHKLSIVRWGNA